MIFSTFIESLSEGSTKNKLVDDMQLARDEFKNHVKPVYETFIDQFSNYQFKSPQLIAIAERFNEEFKIKSRDNFIVNTYNSSLKHIEERVDLTFKLLEDNFTADILRDSLSIRQINVLQYSEVISFVVRYSRRLLNYVVTLETHDVSGTESKNAMKPAELNWIQSNIENYIIALNILTIDKIKATTVFEAIPDVILNRKNADQTVRLTGDKGDPFQFKFIPVALNPFYHVGMRIAEYQAARYHEAKNEQQVIAAKILYLRGKLNGEEDAKRESVIERYEELLSRATYKIHKLEQDAD